MERDAALSLAALLPRLEARLARDADPAAWTAFRARLETHFRALFPLLRHLYGGQYDFFYHLESTAGDGRRACGWRGPPSSGAGRPARGRPRLVPVASRCSAGSATSICFAGDLAGPARADPLLQGAGADLSAPDAAVPGARRATATAATRSAATASVNPAPGHDGRAGRPGDASCATTGISLVVDFVFNHTSDEHDWAKRAQAGDPEYQDYYYIFPDRTMPDAYERTLREIFPDGAARQLHLARRYASAGSGRPSTASSGT